ncbi:hypothetical protein RUM43_004411 [Polyplax serrata]|uniref:Nucleoprotein n=1 Tax=Polyplax serrata TaxID=468196 RepID=A0AAN8XLF6_POLSC
MASSTMCDNATFAEMKVIIETALAGRDDSDIMLSLQSVLYMGFDLVSFVRIVIASGLKAGRTIKMIKNEAATLAVIGALRGNNIENIKKKTTIELVEFLNKVVPVYGITKNPMDKTSATLSRFAVAYSIDVAKNLQKFDGKFTTVNLPAEIEGYPRFMCYASFGALIPTSIRGYKLIRPAYLYHQIKLDRVLNSKIKDYKPDIAKVDKFLQISIDATFYPADKRVTALINLGLIDSDGNVADNYQDPLRAAASKVMSLTSFDY